MASSLGIQTAKCWATEDDIKMCICPRDRKEEFPGLLDRGIHELWCGNPWVKH